MRSEGKGGDGVRHIQEDPKSAEMGGGYHFKGDLSEFVINNLIGPTISTGRPSDRRGSTVAYSKQFAVISPALAPVDNTFTLKVVVDDQTGYVKTVYSPDDIVDDNYLDQYTWAGADLTGGGEYPPATYLPIG